MKLLLAEDEKDLSNAIVKILKHNNYSVDAVYDGIEALNNMEVEEYDGLILDIMMPKMDGLTVVRKLREKGNNIPVLILTAKSEIDDRVLGLDTGADDYLTKPFAMKELLARIRSITRRKDVKLNSFSFGNVTLNPHNYMIKTNKQEIRLTNKEYQIMEMLMINSNLLISTEKLMDTVWGYESESEINVVWVYISSLRKKLLNIEADIIIKAVRGLGYKLEENK